MKVKFFNISLLVATLMIITTLMIVSCEKDTDGTNQMKAGDKLSGTLDSIRGSAGTTVTLKGAGLGRINTILFDKDSVSAPFITTLNTETSLIFRVPDNASGGQQNIIFTNVDGKTLSVPFFVVAMPTVTSISMPDFQLGTTETIVGNNLNDVTKVTIDGTTDQATIVSKSRNQLVITMPATTVNRAKIKVSNSSGDKVSDIELTYVPNAFKVFTEGFVDGMQDWSWAQTHDISTSNAIMGTQSLRGIFGTGAWGAISLHKDDPKLVINDYKYLTFWIKGATADQQFEVFSENGGSHKTITVPANNWTYFKLDLSTFMSGVQLERLDYQMHGPDGSNQTVYFDNILFVK